MSEFVLHPEAVKDLDEIWEHIAADSLDAADRTIEEIYETIQSIAGCPHSIAFFAIEWVRRTAPISRAGQHVFPLTLYRDRPHRRP